ncbi:hypothetical protein BD408DRAFT_416909 [Parasitella parasitica]|nr:hypothetical protein BD408DRAFT_416909 [Parasitella parasitica]
MVLYLVSELLKRITHMAEILSIDVPKKIAEIGGFLQQVDDIERLFLLYEHQMDTCYKNSRALEEKTLLH